MKRVIFFFLSVLLCLPALARDKQLYAAKIPVLNQSTDERSQAMQAALQQVLIKVSGNKGIVTLPIVKDQLAKADTLVQQYRYSRTSNYAPLSLQVSFEPTSIDKLIHQAGQGVWRQARPVIVTWVAVQDKQQTELLSADSDDSLVSLLQQDASDRGLNVSIPLLDLADLTSVDADMVLNKNYQPLQKASIRYRANTLMLISLSQDGDRWSGQWTLLYDDEPLSWKVSAASKEQAIKMGMNNIADFLASRLSYAKEKQNDKSIVMTVSNVKSITDYVKLSDFLRGLRGVKKVEIAKVVPGEVSYKMELDSSVQGLIQLLAKNDLLEPTTASSFSANNNLNYRLVT